MTIDQLAYKLKSHCRPLFSITEVICGYFVAIIHRHDIGKALLEAKQVGSVNGRTATIRPLEVGDSNELLSFFDTLPQRHLKYFHPHGFARRDIDKILTRPYYLTYGVFIDGSIVGYCLLKLYPGKKAFLGRIVSPDLTGCGLGKFFSLYLKWQSRLMGFRLRSTIHKSNIASLESHKSAGSFHVLAELPNQFCLIEFPIDSKPSTAPVLHLVALKTIIQDCEQLSTVESFD